MVQKKLNQNNSKNLNQNGPRGTHSGSHFWNHFGSKKWNQFWAPRNQNPKIFFPKLVPISWTISVPVLVPESSSMGSFPYSRGLYVGLPHEVPFPHSRGFVFYGDCAVVKLSVVRVRQNFAIGVVGSGCVGNHPSILNASRWVYGFVSHGWALFKPKGKSHSIS